METVAYFMPCVYAFLACIGFSLLFNIHGAAGMLICAVDVEAWSEGMARVRKCPVTSYLLVALFPLVPGGGIYYTMEHAVNGETELFLETLMHTLGLAGALAVGVLLVASSVRLFTSYRRREPRR